MDINSQTWHLISFRCFKKQGHFKIDTTLSERWLPKKFLCLNAAVSLYFSQQSAAAVFSCYCVLSSQSTLNISGDETAEKNDIKVTFHLSLIF